MTRSHKGYYYVGPFRYKRDEDGAYSLDKVRFGGGEIIADSTGRLGVAFTITDHLESTRLKVNEGGEIIGSYDYLPYGMLASTSSGLGKDNETLFSGKEYQNALDVAWYDSGARYQTVQGIFTSPDPLAEKYPSISPYAYCAGNPVNLVDPDGKDWIVKDGTIDYIWRDDVKKAKDTPEGFTYVGKSGEDIIRNLGFVGFEQTMETTSASPIAEDLGINWFAYFWTKIKSTSNLLVAADISIGGTSTETKKHGIQFEGIVISAFVSTETFQRSGGNSLGRLSVSYNGILREELLTDASSTSIYPTNSIPTSARIQIPKK